MSEFCQYNECHAEPNTSLNGRLLCLYHDKLVKQHELSKNDCGPEPQVTKKPMFEYTEKTMDDDLNKCHYDGCEVLASINDLTLCSKHYKQWKEKQQIVIEGEHSFDIFPKTPETTFDVIHDAPSKSEKPPLGIMPEHIWREQRCKELIDTLARYVNDERITVIDAVVGEWADELSRHSAWLKERKT